MATKKLANSYNPGDRVYVSRYEIDGQLFAQDFAAVAEGGVQSIDVPNRSGPSYSDRAVNAVPFTASTVPGNVPTYSPTRVRTDRRYQDPFQESWNPDKDGDVCLVPVQYIRDGPLLRQRRGRRRALRPTSPPNEAERQNKKDEEVKARRAAAENGSRRPSAATSPTGKGDGTAFIFTVDGDGLGALADALRSLDDGTVKVRVDSSDVHRLAEALS